jgi:Ankyrin repeat
VNPFEHPSSRGTGRQSERLPASITLWDHFYRSLVVSIVVVMPSPLMKTPPSALRPTLKQDVNRSYPPSTRVPPPRKGFNLFGCICGNNQEIDERAGEPKVASFLRLARERRFDEIVHILNKAKDNKAFIEAWLNVSQDSRVSTCESLHALCMYRPTAAAVRTVIRSIELTLGSNVVADATLVTDASGRTPLHVAVACGCSLEVIEVLLRDESEAVWTLDYSNRYPLHWACTKPNGSRSTKDDIENMVLVINRLMEAYAMAVISKDQQGLTPMDLAVEAKADERILKALQFVTNILPKNKSHPFILSSGSTRTESTVPCAAICVLSDDQSDGLSSVGSRGVSRHARRHRSRSRFLKRIPNLVFL